MKYPTYNLEKQLLKKGYRNIVGIDEVGRGAWAGPLIAVASIIDTKFGSQKSRLKSQIKDSKLLSEKLREKLFEELSTKVIWSIGIVTHKEIDKFGIVQANLLVIKRALRSLEIKPDYLLIDRVYGFKNKLPFEIITKGDRKIFSIAVASILAKVTRDRIMRDYHQQHPNYYFQKHKGYGTKLHQKSLKKHGVCKIHRLSYEPIRDFS